MFQSLCRLADRYRAQDGDPDAAKIGSVLSLLAVYATQPNDQDFRYDLGSLLMDLALDEETRAEEARAAASPSGHGRVVPYARARVAR